MKKTKVLFWISTSIIFLWEGLMPLSTLLFVPEYATAGTKPLGYPDYFAYALIICKVLGSTAIMLPKLPAKLKEWAYAGLMFNLIFATISHIAVDKIASYIIMPMVVAAVLAVSYYCNEKLKSQAKESAAE